MAKAINPINQYCIHDIHMSYVCIPCGRIGKGYGKSLECDFGHTCNGECQETKDCPCVSDHYCSASEHSKEDCKDDPCNLHK